MKITMLKKMTLNNKNEITLLFAEVFCNEPWNDDWSDKKQLNLYIQDLMGNQNSLTLGYYIDEELIGIAMGHIRHWYSGTEYSIDEFCIRTDVQGKGIGSQFIKEIEHYLLENKIEQIFLLTEKHVPAFTFYKKNGFYQLNDNVAFVKKIETV